MKRFIGIRKPILPHVGPVLAFSYLLFNQFQPHLDSAYTCGQPTYPRFDMIIWFVAVLSVAYSFWSAISITRNQAKSDNEIQDEIRHIKQSILDLRISHKWVFPNKST